MFVFSEDTRMIQVGEDESVIIFEALQNMLEQTDKDARGYDYLNQLVNKWKTA
jgi:hypothetical protein